MTTRLELDLDDHDLEVLLEALKVYAAGYAPRMVREFRNDEKRQRARLKIAQASTAARMGDAWKTRADTADRLIEGVLGQADAPAPEWPVRSRNFRTWGRR